MVYLSERERLGLLHDGIAQSFNFLKRLECERFGARDTGENLRRNAYGINCFNAVYLADGDSDLHGVLSVCKWFKVARLAVPIDGREFYAESFRAFNSPFFCGIRAQWHLLQNYAPVAARGR